MSGSFLERRTFYAGKTIFREGEPGSIAYIVQSGRIRIIKEQADGSKGTLGFVDAGGIFGEMALIDHSPRMASAIAEEPSVCIIVPEKLLNKKLSKTDSLVKMMLTVLIRRLRTAASTTVLKPVDMELLIERLINDSVSFEPIVKDDEGVNKS